MAVSFVCAVLAAVANATSNVLTRAAARREPPGLQFDIRLLLDLLRRRVWLIGVGVTIAAYLLQAAALGTGELAVVQPLVVLELPMTLLGAGWVLGARLGRREWIGMAVMTAGLAGLIAFLYPSGGNPGSVPLWVWMFGVGGNAAALAVLYWVGRHTCSPARRAACLGAAAGLGFGLTAALTKGMTQQFASAGVSGALTAWQFYASMVTGGGSMWLVQNAYSAGRLATAQPGVTLLDPFAAILWGVLAFGERTRTGVFLVLAVAAAAAMAAGAVALARSPQLQGQAGARENPDASGPLPGPPT
jgi:drug/metabolite transporter (DMT)-like permease